MASPARSKIIKADPVCAEAVDLARTAAEADSGVMGVGDYLGCVAEAERVVTHFFGCPHPGYLGWRWSVTVGRASRARAVIVNEVVLLPGDASLLSAEWVPWAMRIQPGDVQPGLLMPSPDDDPRLEPGFTGGESAGETDPAEASQIRAVVSELGLGRERVLSAHGRDDAAERWLAGDGGPDNPITKQAPGPCVTCGFFLRVRGGLGRTFGVCTNVYSPSDARVVTTDHGCGAHSSVAAEEQAAELPPPVWDTIEWDDTGSLFD